VTLAYGSILAAILIPYVLGRSAVARNLPGRRVASPRNWTVRAKTAHLVGAEIVPGFAAAIALAHFANLPQQMIDMFGLALVTTRTGDIVSYLAGLTKLRSVIRFAGLACIWGLFGIAAWPASLSQLTDLILKP